MHEWSTLEQQLIFFYLWVLIFGFSSPRSVKSLSEWPYYGTRCGTRALRRHHVFTLGSAMSRECLLCSSLYMPWWRGDLRPSRRPLLTRCMSFNTVVELRVLFCLVQHNKLCCLCVAHVQHRLQVAWQFVVLSAKTTPQMTLWFFNLLFWHSVKTQIQMH